MTLLIGRRDAVGIAVALLDSTTLRLDSVSRAVVVPGCAGNAPTVMLLGEELWWEILAVSPPGQ
jgi:hypothetical protein